MCVLCPCPCWQSGRKRRSKCIVVRDFSAADLTTCGRFQFLSNPYSLEFCGVVEQKSTRFFSPKLLSIGRHVRLRMPRNTQDGAGHMLSLKKFFQNCVHQICGVSNDVAEHTGLLPSIKGRLAKLNLIRCATLYVAIKNVILQLTTYYANQAHNNDTHRSRC